MECDTTTALYPSIRMAKKGGEPSVKKRSCRVAV